ncbi:MAG: glycosyltransferase family 2 protein, partial [Jaaginema sp. PMC 1078.18]|nr:glycosyltransferase family 2 protein [Jaaginema sp. PMC 1078.18]
PNPEPLPNTALADVPTVSLLVSAKNEEAVIARLIENLCNLDYPRDRYEVWAIDDASSDRTPQILDRLAPQYPQLRVLHRPAEAGGGKSGALNQVLPLTQSDILAVFDADAKVSPDLLRRVVPFFNDDNIGAVQVRKAVANPRDNFWTEGQTAEMAFDSFVQRQRFAIGGIGELRGNGQFVRRTALESCGCWNEETITDDLDLTIRLHLDRWDIGFCLSPWVDEEAVTQAIPLWHQRSRWAEGGYQRYLDYWRLLIGNRLGFTKAVDLMTFVAMQYVLPTAAIPDFVMAILRHHFPLLSPLSGFVFAMSSVGMGLGLYQIRQKKGEKVGLNGILMILGQTLRGMVYMVHWLLVMPITTGRMSIRPKRLKWVKTTHQGSSEESLEAS